MREVHLFLGVSPYTYYWDYSRYSPKKIGDYFLYSPKIFGE